MLKGWVSGIGVASLLFVAACSTEGGANADPVDAPIADADAPAPPVDDATGGEWEHEVETQEEDAAPPVEVSDPVDPGPAPPQNCVAWADGSDDPSQALFDPDCVLDVRLEMAPEDWLALRNQTRPLADVVGGDCLDSPPTPVFDWFEADVSVAGRSVSGVGVRKKGFYGSLSEDKPSLKVRFDKFVDDQALAGLSRLTLNNVIQDPGLVSACMGYALMAQAGLPAPRCNFARVQVNGQDLGLYAHVDSIKKPFLARHFSSDEGNLYEATLSDFRPEFRQTWEKKTQVAADDWSDLDAAIEALEVPDAELMSALAAVFDLEDFYTFWASEVLIAHWDGYAGNRNNSYIYADPIDGLFRFIPWGIDSAFLDPQPFIGGDGELPDAVFAFGHLANRLYAHPEGRAAYAARMQELLDTVWDADVLDAELDRMEALLSVHLSEDDASELSAQINAKRFWITHREHRVQTELLAGLDAWEYPIVDSICWVDGGTMTGTFDTRWGTASGDFFDQPGSINHDVSTLDFVGNVSSSARIGAGVTTGQAIVELLGNNTAGEYFVVYIFGALDLFTPDTTQPLDWVSYSGVFGRIDLFDFKFVPLALLVDGVIHFEQASTYMGEPVVGSFEATVVLPP